MHDPLPAFASSLQLDVLGRDRGRDDDVGAGGNGRGVVADDRLDAGCPEPLEIGRLNPVGARNGMSERPADERQPAHPGAADRDEVQGAGVRGHCGAG